MIDWLVDRFCTSLTLTVDLIDLAMSGSVYTIVPFSLDILNLNDIKKFLFEEIVSYDLGSMYFIWLTSNTTIESRREKVKYPWIRFEFKWSGSKWKCCFIATRPVRICSTCAKKGTSIEMIETVTDWLIEQKWLNFLVPRAVFQSIFHFKWNNEVVISSET